MDVMAIAEATGLPPRTLRYAVYHELVPGVGQHGQGKGLVREFAPPQAFAIALSAMLLDAGLKSGLVRQVLAALVRKDPGGFLSTPLLNRAMRPGTPARVNVADGRYYRLRTGDTPPPASRPGWLGIKGGKPPPAGYDPTVVVSLNPIKARDAVSRVP